MPLLNAYDVMGIVDGSYSSPPPLIENFEGENSGIRSNPDYILWHRMDQLVLSWFVSSVSEEIGSQLVGMTTFRDVWLFLEKYFATQSRARIFQFKSELSSLKKGEK